MQKAFIAAEDKRFYQHKGIDERGLIRAFIGNLAQSGRPQGGSTITQQVVKNLLVGDDLTYERKIREMIVAARVERTLSKAEILELYLNSVYLGRGSWGIEMAARSYFGKPAKELTLEEGALLAGLTKGPNYFSPDRHPGRAQERLAYVLSRMQEDGLLPGAHGPAEDCRHCRRWSPTNGRGATSASTSSIRLRARPSRWPASKRSPPTPTRCARRSTCKLQRAVEETLQEGLSRYERSAGRLQFRVPRRIWRKAVERAEADRERRATSGRPGSRRSRMRGCRSTTCIGRPRSWWRSPAGKKGEAGASA